MLLEIDVGNSRIKWRLRNNNTVTATCFVATAAIGSSQHFESLFAEVDVASVTQCMFASVVPEFDVYLSGWASASGIELIQVEVSRECAGVVNGYGDVTAMGVDRWLAMLAASRYSSDCLIIDAGSAITVDLLADCQHQGGYIVPGWRLMNDSLLRNTQKVSIEAEGFLESAQPGKSTQQGVVSGLLLMIKGLVSSSFDQLGLIANSIPAVLVTGGDGGKLAGLLVSEGFQGVRYIPDLVLDGLSIAANTE